MAKAKPIVVQVQMEVKLVWLTARDPDSGSFVGICPPLNLNALGDSYGEMLQCAEDAVQTLFLDLLHDGELDSFLRKNGWAMVGPPIQNQDRVQFSVPYDVSQQPIESLTATA